MQLSLAIQIVLAVLWTAGCAVLATRIFASRSTGRLHTDEYLSLTATLILAIAPWVSLIVYYVSEGQTVLGGLANALVAAVMFIAARRARKARLDPKTAPVASTSFQQKSAILMLLTLTVVYAVYALMTWQVPGLTIPLFVASAVVVTVVAIIGHTGIALAHVPIDESNAARDERDDAAGRYGVHKAYYILATGMWVLPVVSFLQPNVLIVANVAFLFIALAEIVKYASIVRYYHRGET